MLHRPIESAPERGRYQVPILGNAKDSNRLERDLKKPTLGEFLAFAFLASSALAGYES